MEVLNEERRNKLEETKRNSTDEKHTGWMHLGFLGHCISFSKKAEQHHGGAKPHGHGHGHGHGHHGILVSNCVWTLFVSRYTN